MISDYVSSVATKVNEVWLNNSETTVSFIILKKKKIKVTRVARNIVLIQYMNINRQSFFIDQTKFVLDLTRFVVKQKV